MARNELRTSVLALSLAVSGLIVVPAVFFPKASCLRPPHYTVCEIGRVPTLFVLFVVVIALPMTTWLVDPE